MIHFVGTSHVSTDSIEKIDEAFEQHEPDVVCLELDMGRLNSLLADDNSLQSYSMMHGLLARFQRYIGEKTGMMPGEEMLYAYERAKKEDLEIYLIDRDLRMTLSRIGDVSRKEKAKAFAMIPFSLMGGRFDYASIPDPDEIEKVSEIFREKFPQLHQVLLEERDIYMSDSLKVVREEHPDESIVTVVGAAHRKGLEDRLKN